MNIFSLFYLFIFHSCFSLFYFLETEYQFNAGTFMLTQKSLQEAPYRYATILRKALDDVEQKDPPSQSDETGCSVRYRIQPSGIRSKLKIQNESLSIKLLPNNTLTMKARILTEVAAQTWIWKGFSFGLLGCLKISSCNGDIVTYSSIIDFQISFQINWLSTGRLSVLIKPVNTKLSDVLVQGCRPPWYLFWFKRYQELLNSGVSEAVQKYANDYEKMATAPEVFSLYSTVYVTYKITDLFWSTDYVAIQAHATFSTFLNGKNVTYKPFSSLNSSSSSMIPLLNWNKNQYSHSHLLQGIRLSTEFINCLMWYATLTNVTHYAGSKNILDTQINGTIFYSPPTIRVEANHYLRLDVNHGVIQAICTPLHNGSSSALLFKAVFSHLIGYGKIQLIESSNMSMGIRIMMEELDLSQMETKPFEPKLPLPKAFESELMRTAISQLRPVINSYFEGKPLILPRSISPLAAHPTLNLMSNGDFGYVEILSYCSCQKTSKNKFFSLCDKRSFICMTQNNQNERQSDSLPTTNITTTTTTPLNSNSFSHQIKKLSYNSGIFLTIFEKEKNCFFTHSGSTSTVYGLVSLENPCSSVLNTQLLYQLNSSTLAFDCYDSNCSSCKIVISLEEHLNSCVSEFWGSFYLGQTPVSWTSSSESMRLLGTFFTNTCSLNLPQESKLLSVQLSVESNKSNCSLDDNGNYFAWNESEVLWNCEDEKCEQCSFSLSNPQFEGCDELETIYTQLSWTKKLEVSILSENSTFDTSIIVTATIFIALLPFTFFFLYYFKDRVQQCQCSKSLSFLRHYLGLRLFHLYFHSDRKKFVDEIIQNIFLLINGVLAVAFAYAWDSNNNPLVIIHNKFNSSKVSGLELFEMEKMIAFAGNLNFWTYLVNMINGLIAFFLILLWFFTKNDTYLSWTKIRLASSVSLLVGLFTVLALVIFSTYFDDLILLRVSNESFITRNEAMRKIFSQILKISLHGVSLTIISFTIVFLFHGVGAGLFCGTVVFRLLHYSSKRHNLDVLTTFLMILTIMQPFICLHPVIIWCQDSNQNSTFLALIIFIWFLPIGVHSLSRPFIHLSEWSQKKYQSSEKLLRLLDAGIIGIQTAIFLTSFSLGTHHIVNMEFSYKRKNLQEFVLPAIVSVFFWMTSLAYYLLSSVLEDSRNDNPLVFKDQNLEATRDLLQLSLEVRLDGRSSLRRKSLSRTRRHRPSFKSSSPSSFPRQRPLPRPLLSSSSTNTSTILPTTSFEMSESEDHFLTLSYGSTNRLSQLYHFFLETYEYKDPQTHGWRIRYRRIFSILGVLFFSAQTLTTTFATQNYSSKREIQKLLDYTSFNLTWPDSGSILDDVFQLYNDMERTKSYLMILSALLFWSSLLLDVLSHFSRRSLSRKLLLFSGSRIANFFGSLAVFASVIIVGLPDYLSASHLESICPFCGLEFNRTIRQIAEFSIGLFFACLFTFQLIPILVTIIPALVRASVLIVVHPSLHVDLNKDIVNLRIMILQQVMKFSSLLTFPITFISMALLQQFQKDEIVTLLIISFWLFPPLVLWTGLYFAKKYRRYTILLYIYYLYNMSYVSLLLALICYAIQFQKLVNILSDLIVKPSFWTSSLAQVFLCNVVISDMLYMSVF